MQHPHAMLLLSAVAAVIIILVAGGSPQAPRLELGTTLPSAANTSTSWTNSADDLIWLHRPREAKGGPPSRGGPGRMRALAD